MTYLEFHLCFIIPPLLIALFLARNELREKNYQGLVGIFVLALVAFVYTTPWDNYLVYKNVWWYGIERVISSIYYVPVEEYAFFVLQTFLTGLFYLFIASPSKWVSVIDQKKLHFSIDIRAMIAFVLPGIIFSVLLFFTSSFYLGLILFWSMPVVSIQWYFGRKILLRRKKAIIMTILPITVYLWLADLYAINNHIWMISKDYTTGFHILGLPIEEAIFFLVTNIMVVQGLCLFLDPSMRKVVLKK